MSATRGKAGSKLLTRQLILDSALRFIDEQGLERLTLRRLGEALDRDPTALYRHYRSKADLLTAVADKLLGDIVVDFSPSDDWRDTLRDLTKRVRGVYLAHPSFGRVLGYSPDTLLNNARVYEQLLGALEQSGLAPEAIGHYANVLARWTVCLSSYDAEGLQLAIDEPDSPYATRFAFAALPGDAFARCVRYAPQLFASADDSFEAGYELLLDAIAAAAAKG